MEVHVVNEALATLKSAKRRRVPWYEVAKAVMLVEDASPLSPEGRPWIEVAEYLSGYDAPLLRRYIMAHRFIEDASSKSSRMLPAKKWSFSLLEILKRIHDVDSEKAVDIVYNNNDGLKQRELSAVLSELRRTSKGKSSSPIAEGKIAAREFCDLCLFVLKNGGMRELYNKPDSKEPTILRWRVPHRWVSPDLAIIHDNNKEIDAVDCYIGLTYNRQDAIRRRIRDVAFESAFFDRFWIIIPYDSGVGRLFSSFMSEIDLRNVGIIEINRNTRRIENVTPIINDIRGVNHTRKEWTDYEKSWLR